ncbi:ABC transporter permease [Puia sp. P3]|uniref:ABC transporter permease n=1 Tax=Puia sp. P3 TaxID=3423952 RepID=UPI003D674343
MLKIFSRYIRRNKFYTAVNILGLSLGLTACLVIYTIIHHELSFDRFHPGSERIYRVMGDLPESSGKILHFARIPLAASTSTPPGLESIASCVPYPSRPTAVYTQSKYFSIFPCEWLAGNPATALQTPSTVVLTQAKARFYFGNTAPADIIGKQIVFDDSAISSPSSGSASRPSARLTVSGIVKDRTQNTDFNFTEFISSSTDTNTRADAWTQGDMSAWTFIKLQPNTKPAAVDRALAAFVQPHLTHNFKLRLRLQPLANIHFDADVIENPVRTAHMPTLYGLLVIAGFILLLAVINFINLSTAQSLRRAKEVGIRKVLGSTRTSLRLQFLFETALITGFSILLAVTAVRPTLQLFHAFLPPGLKANLLAGSTIAFIAAIFLTTTLLAGFYPAKVLSSYLPALSLKGGAEQKGGEQWLLRKSLIVFQFATSLVFIIGSFVITAQLRYAREIDPGFSSDAILTVDAPRGDSIAKAKVLAERLRSIPGISQTALQWVTPMTDNTRGMALKSSPADPRPVSATQVVGDENFIPLYRITLLAGKNISPADSVRELVINETLSRLLGDKTPEQSLGRILYWNDRPYPVTGVVADFHTKSIHDPILPACIINRPDRKGSVAVRLATNNPAAVLPQMAAAWKDIYPGRPFTYRFFDESLARLYENDRRTATLIDTSMATTILISCIGLFGLALFTAEKKAKEISIRKVLGATTGTITVLLFKNFLSLIILALLIATPFAWFLSKTWLDNFAYHIRLSPGPSSPPAPQPPPSASSPSATSP